MANLQILKKRYKSIQATADMAAAMKTASSVKYAKISRIFSSIDAYSKACDDSLALFGSDVLARDTQIVKNRNCLVLFSNDRGFCGGFNSELLRFFDGQMANEAEKPLLFIQGQKAVSFCNAKGYEFERLVFSDIPSYADAEALTAKLYEIYTTGEADWIELIYQRFDNMMTQTPVRETLLPRLPKVSGDDPQEILFLPDRETAQKAPAMYCLVNSVYRIMLGHAAGAQAATTIAMRSACDNADKSLEKLEILINRIRQAEVTNSVIETSSFLAGQYINQN
jgi:F-type H+-transporting ATPase subunit gamma